MSLSIPRSL